MYLRYNDPFLSRRATAYQLPEITVRDLQIACRGAQATAAGPDCLAPAELRFFSDNAFLLLAQLLICIEDCGDWPADLRHARSAYLAKNPDNATEHWHIRSCFCSRYCTDDVPASGYDT